VLNGAPCAPYAPARPRAIRANAPCAPTRHTRQRAMCANAPYAPYHTCAPYIYAPARQCATFFRRANARYHFRRAMCAIIFFTRHARHARHDALWCAMTRYGALWCAMTRYGALWCAMTRYHFTPAGLAPVRLICLDFFMKMSLVTL